MAIKSYRDLIVWQRAMDLAEAVYGASSSWPESERFGLISQVRRAAVSIPSNIAEGHGRRADPEFRYFLGIAHGSLCELETCFALAERLKLSKRSAEDVTALSSEVGRLLGGIYRTIPPKRR